MMRSVMAGILLTLGFQSLAFGTDESVAEELPYNTTFNDLPANWDFLELPEDVIESYRGEDIREVCYDDDLLSRPDEYPLHREVVRKPSRGFQSRDVQTWHKLSPFQDFIVVGDNELVVTSESTGSVLLETRICHQSLRRAKNLLLSNEINRSRPNRCYIRQGNVFFMTRFRGGYQSCEIHRITDWTGPTDWQSLTEAAEAELTE